MADVVAEAPARAVAVYAHPDDHEISCGGTLARWARAGAEVHVVIGTRGEKGSTDPDTDVAALAERRAAEVAAAADVLGLAGVDLLGHPDGELENTAVVREAIVGVLRRVRPDAVVCPDPTAVFFGDGYVNHHDHRSIGWATLDAVAPMAASPLYFRETGPAHQVATLYLSGTVEPDVFVDVEDTLDVKVDALLCHESQLGEDRDWLRDVVRHRAGETGRQAGIRFAESFRRLRFAR